jgi:hypothetical protein
LEDVFGDMKDVTGTEDTAGVGDMMTGVGDMMTGVEKEAESTKIAIRNEGSGIHRNPCHKNGDTPKQGSAAR